MIVGHMRKLLSKKCVLAEQMQRYAFNATKLSSRFMMISSCKAKNDKKL